MDARDWQEAASCSPLEPLAGRTNVGPGDRELQGGVVVTALWGGLFILALFPSSLCLPLPHGFPVSFDEQAPRFLREGKVYGP